MQTVNIHEAKTHLSKLIESVVNGEEVMIAKAGKPVAKLIPIHQSTHERKLGLLKGKIKISDDFDQPLAEEQLKDFYGE